jgi:hypothetical protein
VSLKKAVAWLLFALVVFFVIKSPDHAAQYLRDAGTGLGNAVSSLASFVGSLV